MLKAEFVGACLSENFSLQKNKKIDTLVVSAKHVALQKPRCDRH